MYNLAGQVRNLYFEILNKAKIIPSRTPNKIPKKVILKVIHAAGIKVWK
jgi:hypothetical protein